MIVIMELHGIISLFLFAMMSRLKLAVLLFPYSKHHYICYRDSEICECPDECPKYLFFSLDLVNAASHVYLFNARFDDDRLGRVDLVVRLGSISLS